MSYFKFSFPGLQCNADCVTLVMFPVTFHWWACLIKGQLLCWLMVKGDDMPFLMSVGKDQVSGISLFL